MIVKKLHPKKLFLIDQYLRIDTYDRGWFGADLSGQEEMDRIYSAVQERFQDQIETGTIEMIRSNSIDALRTIENGSLDWVYIDGDHNYEFVSKDLETSWDKIRCGGFISGDDYRLEGWWHNGVTKAVNEFLAKHSNSIEQTFFLGTQFLFQKKTDK